MNHMLALALSEKHKKRLPNNNRPKGVGNPNVIRQSKLVTKKILKHLSTDVEPMTVRRVSECIGEKYNTVYNRMRVMRANGIMSEQGIHRAKVGRGQGVLWGLSQPA